jgi:hypothetical protein
MEVPFDGLLQSLRNLWVLTPSGGRIPEELENSAQIGQPGYQSQQQPMVHSQSQQQRPAARHHLSETLANDFTSFAVAGINSGNW